MRGCLQGQRLFGLFIISAVFTVGCKDDRTQGAIQFLPPLHPCVTAPYCIYDDATGTARCEDGYVRQEPESDSNFECIECAFVTCEEMVAPCGIMDDGCGGMLDCGQCLENEECGIEIPNQCTNTSCEASDCESANAECGTIDNGCGRTIDCGLCDDGDPCGVVVPNRCGSVDLSQYGHLRTKKVAVSETGERFCSVFSNDQFMCWGQNYRGLTHALNEHSDIHDMDGNCFLKASGTVECLFVSNNRASWVTVPGGPYSQVIRRSPNTNIFYFLTAEGRWAGYTYEGGDRFVQAASSFIPEGEGLLGAMAPGDVACSITQTGDLQCHPLDSDNPDPMGLISAMPQGGPFIQIDGFSDFYCALSIGGKIDCWGHVPERSSWSPEVEDFFDAQFIAMTVNEFEVCGLYASTGRVRCVQADQNIGYHGIYDGTFGPGYETLSYGYIEKPTVCVRNSEGDTKCLPQSGEQLIQGRFKDMSYSDELLCAVDMDGQIRCNNGWAGFEEAILQPMNRLGPFEKVSAWKPDGFRNPQTNVCAINASGRLTCRDVNGRDPGYLVDAHTALRTVNFVEFVMGQASGCGLTTDGSIRCAGWDFFGQVSNAPPEDGFTQLTAGAKSYCATKPDGTAMCWGENYTSFEDSLKYVALSPEQTGTIIGLSLDGQIFPYRLADRHGSFGRALSTFSPQNTVALSTTLDTLCALSKSGELSCTGNRGRGIEGLEQLQRGTFQKISVSEAPTVCALTTAGKIGCTGWYVIPLNDLALEGSPD